MSPILDDYLVNLTASLTYDLFRAQACPCLRGHHRRQANAGP